MKKVIITGSCGFIGTCFSLRLLKLGWIIHGIDNLSRKGSELNLKVLEKYKNFKFHKTDITHKYGLELLFEEIGNVDAVFHLAAQVAVTKSYENITYDFMQNAYGTLNILECIKKYSPNAYCLYASTNKVFGHIKVQNPVSCKDYPLSPYTPYGCSKAIGEMYFTEFGTKELGLKTCSLRQSCIYGPYQYGVEDQGWLAHFAIANLNKTSITIYGDGKQVRDLLYIDDLIDLYITCMEKQITGVYPVGGGIENSINLLQGLDIIKQITNIPFNIKYGKERPGDQPYFVADLSEINEVTGWYSKVKVNDGVKNMVEWIKENKANNFLKK